MTIVASRKKYQCDYCNLFFLEEYIMELRFRWPNARIGGWRLPRRFICDDCRKKRLTI